MGRSERVLAALALLILGLAATACRSSGSIGPPAWPKTPGIRIIVGLDFDDDGTNDVYDLYVANVSGYQEAMVLSADRSVEESHFKISKKLIDVRSAKLYCDGILVPDGTPVVFEPGGTGLSTLELLPEAGGLSWTVKGGKKPKLGRRKYFTLNELPLELARFKTISYEDGGTKTCRSLHIQGKR